MLDWAPALFQEGIEVILGECAASLRAVEQTLERSLVDLGEIAACTTGLNMSNSPFLAFNIIQTHSINIYKSKSKLHAHLERPLSVRWSVLAIIRQTNPQSSVETQL